MSVVVGVNVTSGLTEQRIGLLHSFAVAYLLGADAIVEPLLSTPSGLGSQVSLQHYYNTTTIANGLRQLNMTLIPSRPPTAKVVTLKQDPEMRGHRMQSICSKVRTFVKETNITSVFVDLGVAPGFLRVEAWNFGLISFIIQHLEYKQDFKIAAQRISDSLQHTFNGLHLPSSKESMADFAIARNGFTIAVARIPLQYNDLCCIRGGQSCQLEQVGHIVQ